MQRSNANGIKPGRMFRRYRIFSVGYDKFGQLVVTLYNRKRFKAFTFLNGSNWAGCYLFADEKFRTVSPFSRRNDILTRGVKSYLHSVGSRLVIVNNREG